MNCDNSISPTLPQRLAPHPDICKNMVPAYDPYPQLVSISTVTPADRTENLTLQLAPLQCYKLRVKLRVFSTKKHTFMPWKFGIIF